MPLRGPKSRACDACYRRKIQCDSGRPCDWCLHHQSECTYIRANPRKRSCKTARRVGLIERTRRLDECAGNTIPTQARETRGISRSTPPRLPDTIPYVGAEGGNFGNELPHLIPEGLRWIWSRTGLLIPYPTSQTVSWGKPQGPSVLESNNLAPELPDIQRLENFVDVYRCSALRRIFPIIDTSLFSQTVKAAYSHAHPPHIQNHSAQACVFTFMALMSSLYHLDPSYSGAHIPFIPRDAYIAGAKTLLPAMIQGPLSLDSLQTTVSLAIISILAGEIQAGIHYTAVASRLLIAAGAHVLPNDPDCMGSARPSTRKHLRSLFWFCYTLDKDLALRTGQPHSLRDEDCDLNIPESYRENFHLCLDYSPTDYDTVSRDPVFPCHLHLSKIKSRTYTALYSHGASRKSDVDLFRSIRELDEELECWRLSLPEKFRPRLSFAPGQFKSKNTYIFLTHMNYYCCVNLIHLAGGRCSAWHSDSSEGKEIQDGLRSSLALSVEASRSLLLSLDDSEAQISAGSFWSLLFYPISAVLTIFCNLLFYPIAETTQHDLYLLTMAETTMARLFARRNGVFDRESDLQPVTEFISALREHAQRAILEQSLIL